MIFLVLPDVAQDEEILALARSGDEDAIVTIYRSYFDPVYQFCRLRVGDDQTAQDLTSEVFIRFIKALKRETAPHTSLRGWIFRVTRNLIYDYYGQDKELPVETLDQWLIAQTDTDPEVRVLQTMQVERARRAIGMLSPAQQEVLMLRFDQQLSLQETADLMNRQPNAIKALQFRAVNTLRQILLQMQEES
jgi:RNA polymerase sigma-70 factor, ECF subfamily